MAMADQETAEYYNWLFRIEAQEFEKELLDIVSTNLYLRNEIQQGTFMFI